MTKNVRVVDGAGNLLDSTYPKRALGLVKHGRARFIDPNTIELTRPPSPQGEETTMQTQSQDQDTTTTAPIGGHSGHPASHTPASRQLTANDILQRIDLLIGETAYLLEGVDALRQIDSSGAGNSHSPGDIGTQAKAKATAITAVIEQREQTNRKMISLLDRMYDDLSPATAKRKHPRTPEETQLIERLIDQSPEMSDDTLRAFLEALA